MCCYDENDLVMVSAKLGGGLQKLENLIAGNNLDQ